MCKTLQGVIVSTTLVYLVSRIGAQTRSARHLDQAYAGKQI
jgi:hypothetical protein